MFVFLYCLFYQSVAVKITLDMTYHCFGWALNLALSLCKSNVSKKLVW